MNAVEIVKNKYNFPVIYVSMYTLVWELLKKKKDEDALWIEEENWKYKKGFIPKVNKLKCLQLDTVFGDGNKSCIEGNQKIWH